MTKDRIVAILRREMQFVSGAQISRMLGISRAAVNAAVMALRQEGFTIESCTNRGYRLVSGPGCVNTGELTALLGEERMSRVMCRSSVDSTNNLLQTLSREGAPDGQIAVANHQTSGRGRLGRSFSSPKNRGIYLSMLLRPQCDPAQIANITAWAAVAMCDAVESCCGIRPGIKWVNDLILNNRKICGILTEMAVEGETGRIQHVICGIGMNVSEQETDFPEEIRQIASSIAMETGRIPDRNALAAAMIRQLDQLVLDWPDQKYRYLEAYRKDCVMLGREVQYIRAGEAVQGKAVDVDDDFALVVIRTDGRQEVISCGEVSVRSMYGYV